MSRPLCYNRTCGFISGTPMRVNRIKQQRFFIEPSLFQRIGSGKHIPIELIVTETRQPDLPCSSSD